MAKVYNWQLGRQMDYRFDGGPAKRQRSLTKRLKAATGQG